jgi:uncharacterized surface protein with fasciclin (FAS1) repeats
MKKLFLYLAAPAFLFLSACGENKSAGSSGDMGVNGGPGVAAVQDDVSNPNVVQVAVGSPDHKTLVQAVVTAQLVDALSNPGPFTVFAPTDAAFAALPAGTVEELLKPNKRADLVNILEYHTNVGALRTDYFADGQSYEQVNGKRITISVVGDKYYVNGDAEIIASVKASNGIVHVINKVLLPQ